MDFLPENIIEYCQNYSSEEDKILYELNRQTNLKVLRPRMLSGHLQGQFLKMLSCMIQPQHILEIGTYTGYAAICLAKGLKKNGSLHTIEINSELEDIIKEYIGKADLQDKIHLHLGNALDIIPALNVQFDMVFIDADKENYIEYFELVFNKLNTGGFIIADNVLWNGKVINKDTNDKETLAIKNFNEYIKNREGIEHFLLPFRDGLMIIKKL